MFGIDKVGDLVLNIKGLISEMPVRLTSSWGLEELCLPEEYDNPCFSSEGVEECIAGSTTLPDLWGKFDLLDSPLLGPCDWNVDQGDCDDVKWKWGGAEDVGSSPETARTVKHDCMWGGRCASHEHKSLSVDTVASEAPIVSAGHSVLKSNVLRTSGPPPARPDTPQSLSEDDDLELDSTCDDHRRVIVCVSEVLRVPETVSITQTSVPPPHVHSDHSYHLSKGAPVRVDHLGVQTPSDSEEEIDVVSLAPVTPCRTISDTLPTNPSVQDCHELQITIGSAITKQHHHHHHHHHSDRRKNVGSGRVRGAGRGRRGVGRRPSKLHRQLLQKKQPRLLPRQGEGVDDDSEPDEEKRSLHNDMERQRRIDLRNLVAEVRDLVPAVTQNERAAKVKVLKEASHYCRELEARGRSLAACAAELRRRQSQLRARLSALRRSLAAKR